MVRLYSHIVVFVLSLISCAFSSLVYAEVERLTGGGSNIMYIITPDHSNPVFKIEAEVASATAKELGYEVKLVIHEDNPVKQSQLFSQAIEDKAAIILCINAGSDATVASVKRAREHNIPTIIFDREISELGLAVAQIISNNYRGAKDVAKIFVEAMDYEGEYAELYGIDADANAKIRSSAFHEVIDQYHDMQIVAVHTASWDLQTGYEKTKEILEAHPNLKGLISSNDNMAVGAVKAIKEAGKKIHVISIDGSNDARDAILEGYIIATALQPCAMIAKMAVLQADRYLKTGSTGKPEKQFLNCLPITRENAARVNNFALSVDVK